jgi:hypothetical protein
MKMKTAPKLMLIAGVVIGGFFGIKALMDKGYLSQKATIGVSIPDKIDLPAAGGIVSPAATTSINARAQGESIRVKTIPWNGTSGMHYASAAGCCSRRHNSTCCWQIDLIRNADANCCLLRQVTLVHQGLDTKEASDYHTGNQHQLRSSLHLHSGSPNLL